MTAVLLARLALGGALLLAGACSLAKSALHALLSSKSQFCLLVSKQTRAQANCINCVMAAAPARRPVVQSSLLELGMPLGKGANYACVQNQRYHLRQGFKTNPVDVFSYILQCVNAGSFEFLCVGLHNCGQSLEVDFENRKMIVCVEEFYRADYIGGQSFKVFPRAFFLIN